MQAASLALSGLKAATARFDASAQRTARAGDPAAETDLVTDTVERISAKHDFSANLAVLKTADEMTRRLLDLKV